MRTANPTPIAEILEVLTTESRRHFDVCVPYSSIAARRTEHGFTGNLTVTQGDGSMILDLTDASAGHLAERRGVQKPAQLPGTELPRVNRHAFLPMPFPLRATPRRARG